MEPGVETLVPNSPEAEAAHEEIQLTISKPTNYIMEEWKDIPEFEGYQVSNLGRVRRVSRKKEQILRQYTNKRGYLEARLSKHGKSTQRVVHRLVAKAFIYNELNAPQVNHVDGVKTNNNVYNLEWVTNSENQKHAYKIGLKKNPHGEMNPRATISDEIVTRLKQLYNSGKSVREASEQLNIKLHVARAIIYRTSWLENRTVIERRDDRCYKSVEAINKTFRTKHLKNISGTAIVQMLKDGTEIRVFRSINNASKQTGIPRKSIEAVVNQKKFYSRDNSKYWIMEDAGGFIWKKTKINQIEQYL